jgi:speckle-type POZ protein
MFLNQTHFNFLFMFNNGQSVGAHAEILSAGSPVLSALFQSSCLELKSRKMSIIDCEIHVFKQFLVFLYTNNAPLLSKKTTRNLFVLADKYLVAKLKDHCLYMMLTQVNIQNVIDILGWSQFYSTHKLYERAMQFCVSHFRELCFLQEWKELETVDIDLFLRVHQEVADLLSETNGTADQPRAEPHEENVNSS